MEAPLVTVRFSGGRPPMSLARGECMAVTGAGTESLSRFCRRLAGEEPPRGMSVSFADGVEDRVRLVSFSQQSAAARHGGFMQARYHSIVDDAGPGDTVADVLAFNRVFGINPFEVGRTYRAERRMYAAMRRMVEPVLRIDELKGRPFLALSNGETRRVLLARAILSAPALLVLDDPFAGLDYVRREQLKGLLDALAAHGTAMFIAVRHRDEMPACATGRTGHPGRTGQTGHLRRTGQALRHAPAPSVPSVSPVSPVPVVELRDIRIAYGKRKLFDGLSWTVRRGERWVLKGPNGSGKTTLLSLITGDNPLAYANDVTVFGMRREPGVELARIRRRIGMVSPEQQAYPGEDAERLLSAALRRRPDLLLLDEPCQNLSAAAAKRLHARVLRYLSSHPSCAAICVAHRPDDVPPGFTRHLSLDGR